MRRLVAQLDVTGFNELTGRGVFYGASPSDAAATHGLDVHVIGAGNSGGQAAMFFSNYARQRHDPLPRRLAREEHVELPDPPAGDAGERHSALPERDRRRARRRCDRGGRDRRPRDAGRSSESRRAASTSSSARTPRPAGCRRRSRSTAAASSSPEPTCPPPSGRASAIPTCSRRAFPGSSPAATSAQGS